MSVEAAMPSAAIQAQDSLGIWQPIALAMQLAKGAIQPIRLNQRDLVLWRAASGEIAVWEDRCPHRGMKLSFGAVRDGSLLCPYHGWTFGTNGQCQHLPAHPDIKPSRAMRATIYRAEEAQGFIWVNLDHSEIPLASYAMLEGLELTPIRTLHIPAAAETVCVNLPALVQLQTVSGALLGKGEIEVQGEHIGFIVLVQPCDPQSCALHIAAIGSVKTGAALAIVQAFTRFRLKLLPEK